MITPLCQRAPRGDQACVPDQCIDNLSPCSHSGRGTGSEGFGNLPQATKRRWGAVGTWTRPPPSITTGSLRHAIPAEASSNPRSWWLTSPGPLLTLSKHPLITNEKAPRPTLASSPGISLWDSPLPGLCSEGRALRR